MTRAETAPASSQQEASEVESRKAARSDRSTRKRPAAQSPQLAARSTLPPCGRDWLIQLFTGLVEPFGQALPISCEVVLHDLAKLPNSIIAVHGDVTGRQVGDPATDLLLQRLTAGNVDHMLGYSTRLPDGRQLRSTTMIIRDATQEPVAALCINSDLSMWRSVERIAAAMIGDLQPVHDGEPKVPLVPQVPTPTVDHGDPPSEVFARDVDELASHLVHQAVSEQGVPVDLMKKEHKLAVVRSLKARGMFMLRDAVEMIASSLQVTRFTIYNYLNEIENQATDGKAANSRGTRRKA